MNRFPAPLLVGLFATAILASSNDVVAQQTKVESLEKRVAHLERIVSQLLERIRIVGIESTFSSRPQPVARPGEALVSKGNWRVKSNWRKLQKGMAMAAVERLLGEPDKVEAGGSLTWWHWKDGRSFDAPRGHVIFDEGTQTVYGWDEPAFR